MVYHIWIVLFVTFCILWYMNGLQYKICTMLFKHKPYISKYNNIILSF